MKRMNIFLSGIILLAGFASCDLTLIPEDTVTPETFFKSRTDLDNWCNYYYNIFETAETYSGRNADDMVDNSLGDLVCGTRYATDDLNSKNEWYWRHLRNINYCLERIGQCEDEAAAAEYTGVCYFFRALTYFEKVMRFGDVPWYDHVIGSDEEEALKRPRDDRGFVMDKVMEDLDNAIALLPSTKDVYHVTKWTALALKSRAALFEGTWRIYHSLPDAEKYLRHAADAAGTFIDESGYTIYKEGATPYRDLFNSLDAKDSEVILARRYSQTAAVASSLQFNLRNSKMGLTKRFMNHYLLSNGEPFTSLPDYQTKMYKDEVTGRDPRLAQTVLCPGYDLVRNVNVTGVSKYGNDFTALTGYEPIKFAVDCSEQDYSGASKSFNDFPLFRAAEVYLNYAEALAELGEITQTDLDKSIKPLRDRVGMPSIKLADLSAADPYMLSCYPNAASRPNAAVILEIRRERTVELVMEGLRQWDMLRWKEGLQIVNKDHPYYGMYIPGAGVYDLDGDGKNDTEFYTASPTSSTKDKLVTLKIGSSVILSGGDSGYIVAWSSSVFTFDESRDYLWPIPAAQRVSTGGALTQNPGWNDGLSF
ncbi:MAG: RagB/SusD family nutrient uptake outer membrane protein [Candidatus Cryptobacteroides sp.]